MLKNSMRIKNCVFNAFEKFKSTHKKYNDYYATTVVSDDLKHFYIVIFNSERHIYSRRFSIKFKRYKELYESALNYFKKNL